LKIIFFFIIVISGYCYHYSYINLNAWESAYNTLALFALDIRVETSEIDKFGNSWWIYSTALAAAGFSVYSIVSLLVKDISNSINVFLCKIKKYDLLIGLGEQNSNFLESLQDRSSTLIIEPNLKNKNVEYYRDKGFAVINKKAEDAILNLNLSKLKNAVISTGNDRQNIEIAIKLIEQISDDKEKKIFVRIENRDLNILFQQNIIKKEKNIEVIAYSLYENMVKELFSHHTVIGNQLDLIKTDKEYNIVLIGDSPLAVEIVYQLVILANLPNENILNIHLVDKNAVKFHQKLKKYFPQLENIPHITINTIKLDNESLDFYVDDIWHKEDLTNIIIATDDENINLDIAINLQDTTYIKNSAEKILETKILVAIYHDLGLANSIDNDNGAFSNFYTFADIAKASSYTNLIDEQLDIIAKWINANYEEDKVKKSDLNRHWLSEKMTPHKRASSKAQALHIDTKLISLGLEKSKSDKPYKELKQINQKVFDIFNINCWIQSYCYAFIIL
jgi:hypothetical protein